MNPGSLDLQNYFKHCYARDSMPYNRNPDMFITAILKSLFPIINRKHEVPQKGADPKLLDTQIMMS